MELAECLRARTAEVAASAAVTGFDGFVDEMITVVGERHNLDTFTRVEDIGQFGDLIRQAAGHSSLREIVVTAVHPGGCAVNMGDGLAALGVRVETFATVGQPIHPAFAGYAQSATLHSWGREPGRTLAFEFADGKLMFSAVAQLREFEPGAVRRLLADGAFARACAGARLLAFTNWSLYPHMTAVWRLLQQTVLPGLRHRPWLLIDLVDPSSRSEADIRAMLQTLAGFAPHTRPVLGLNQNEANILARLLSLPTAGAGDAGATLDQARALRDRLGVEQVVIHALAHAACARADGAHAVGGPWCARPLKSTGAGDRFNAGYALGLMLELPPEAGLLLAVACSGFFVRNARSARLGELAAFLEAWARGELDR